jgi:hypothetical protein
MEQRDETGSQDDAGGVRGHRWEALADVARWAPSPHNIQPWRLRALSEDEAELLCLPDRLLPDTDPTGRFTAVGLGIFVETLAIAARANGIDLVAEYDGRPLTPDAAEAIPFARLRLVPVVEHEELAPELIRERRTSRLPYDGRPVPDAVLRELDGIGDAHGHRVRFSSDPELVRWVLELNREALFFDLTDQRARREVGGWLRFSRREAAEQRDGFSPAALGFPGWLLSVFFHARGVFDLPGLRAAVHRLYDRTMRGTRTVAWIQGPFEEPAHWVLAGRMLARLWLTLTKHGVQLHPFGSIITNEEANERLRRRIEHDPAAGTLWLIMRLGYSAEPPRSHRLETRELLVR